MDPTRRTALLKRVPGFAEVAAGCITRARRVVWVVPMSWSELNSANSCSIPKIFSQIPRLFSSGSRDVCISTSHDHICQSLWALTCVTPLLLDKLGGSCEKAQAALVTWHPCLKGLDLDKGSLPGRNSTNDWMSICFGRSLETFIFQSSPWKIATQMLGCSKACLSQLITAPVSTPHRQGPWATVLHPKA